MDPRTMGNCGLINGVVAGQVSRAASVCPELGLTGFHVIAKLIFIEFKQTCRDPGKLTPARLTRSARLMKSGP